MSASKDRLFRLLAMLRLIPRAPKSISTTELLEKLKAEQFEIDLRSLQRDLMGRLSLDFPLQCDESQRPYRWSFAKDTPQFGFPTLDMQTALAFVLAERHLRWLLPPSVLLSLVPHFDLAQQKIFGGKRNHLARWAANVRALPNGKTLEPAEVDSRIWEQVATALLDRWQLEIVYLSRSKGERKGLRLHPLGLVSRHSVSYLIGVVEGFADVRQFALHRIEEASCLDAPVCEPADFDVDDYIRSGGFNNPTPVGQHLLVADVAPQVAWLLRETPLSAGQSLEPLPESDWQRLRAEVPDDQETLWWIFGLGENILLHAPHEWVQRISARVDRMSQQYAQSRANFINLE